MKFKAMLFIILLLNFFPLYSETLSDDDPEEYMHGLVDARDFFKDPNEDKNKPKKKTDIEILKEKMTKGLPDQEMLYDITDQFYNDPEKADLFLEAHFNEYDNPKADPIMKIKLSPEDYNKNKELYKKIRDRQLILTSTTAIFKKYSDTGEYPTGGLLSKHDYDYSKKLFDRIFDDEESALKYRWRIKGKKHYTPNIFLEGRIRISVPPKIAKNLTGDFILYSVKKATIMGIFRIKEKTSDHLTIEPIRYMLIWRKKKTVYTNFKASLDPAKIGEASKDALMSDADEFGDTPDDKFDNTSGNDKASGDDFGDGKDTTKSEKKTKTTSDKESQKKSKDEFVDDFGDFSEE